MASKTVSTATPGRFEQAKAALEAKYELMETLGTGAFSEVKRGVNRATGETFAVKIIDRQKCVGKENMIQSEISILQQVKHPNIIQLYELFETDQQIYLVMQLVTGGELFDSIIARGHYTEADAANIVGKILQAVDYLHSHGIAHRDLKPENLLFYSTEPDAKIMISDFGLSKIFNDEEVMKTACGTPGYVAPEVLVRKGYGRQVDLWSLGVITYILLCGYPPFYHENNQDLFQLIMRAEYEFDSPNWDDISSEAKDFISQMLIVDPKKRVTAAKALQHPFITMNTEQEPEAAPFKSAWETASTTTERPTVAPTAAMAEPTLATATGTMATERPKVTSRVPSNLAQRVSDNLRSRGMSTSTRRRSVDPSNVGIGHAVYHSNVPTHAPPPVPSSRGSKAVVETQQQQQQNRPLSVLPGPPSHPPPQMQPSPITEAEDENAIEGGFRVPDEEVQPGRPLQAKRTVDDSGVHVNKSASSANVNAEDARVTQQPPVSDTLRSEDDLSFLNELAVVNRLIEAGHMEEAYTLLQTIDGCPYKLRQLYDHILISGGVAIDVSAAQNTAKGASRGTSGTENFKQQAAGKQVSKQQLPAQQQVSAESFLADMAVLVERMQSNSAVVAPDSHKEMLDGFERLKIEYVASSAQQQSRPESGASGRVLQSLLDKAKMKLESIFGGGGAATALSPLRASTNNISRVPSRGIGLANTPVTLGVPATVSPLCSFQYPTPPKMMSNTAFAGMCPVRLLSYNLCLRPPGVKSNPATSAHKDARLSHFIAHVLPHYDVVALQEVFAFGSSRRDRLLRKAKAEGFHYWVCSSAKQELHNLVDGGLMLLSRFPVVDRKRMVFEERCGTDRFYGKGALYAKVQLPFVPGCDGKLQYMHLFNTQLQVNDGRQSYEQFDPLDECTSVRYRQVTALKAFVDTQLRGRGAHDLAFIAGDMHINARCGVQSRQAAAASGDEYQAMKRALEGHQALGDIESATEKPTPFRLRDLLLENLGEHPVTIGDIDPRMNNAPAETVLTSPAMAGVCASTDYIFQLVFAADSSSAVATTTTTSADDKKRAVVDVSETRIERFQKYIPLPEELAQMAKMAAGTKQPNDTADIVKSSEIVFSNMSSTADGAALPLGTSPTSVAAPSTGVRSEEASTASLMDATYQAGEDVMASMDGVDQLPHSREQQQQKRDITSEQGTLSSLQQQQQQQQSNSNASAAKGTEPSGVPKVYSSSRFMEQMYREYVELVRREQFTQLSDHYAVTAVIRGYTE